MQNLPPAKVFCEPQFTATSASGLSFVPKTFALIAAIGCTYCTCTRHEVAYRPSNVIILRSTSEAYVSPQADAIVLIIKDTCHFTGIMCKEISNSQDSRGTKVKSGTECHTLIDPSLDPSFSEVDIATVIPGYHKFKKVVVPLICKNNENYLHNE
jgi:hypothetical protein